MFRLKQSTPSKTPHKEIAKFHLKNGLLTLQALGFVFGALYLHSLTIDSPPSQITVNLLKAVGIFGFLLRLYKTSHKYLEPTVRLAVTPHFFKTLVTFLYLTFDTCILVTFDQFSNVLRFVSLLAIGLKFILVIPMQNLYLWERRQKCVILGGKEHGLIPGCGVNLKRDRSSLEVKLISLNYNILSNKAFFKKKVRKVSQQTFTHWLPIYLGNVKKKGQHIELLKRALSYFKAGCTKYSPESIQQTIITMFPKLVSNTLYEVMSSQVHAAYNGNALTYLVLLFASFDLLQQEYPYLQTRLTERIDLFIRDEQNRIKQALPSLGDILAIFLLCENYSFRSNRGRHFLDLFLKEQSDRHVLWILQKYPHFATFRSDQDHMRIDDSFNEKKSSYSFLMGAYCLEKLIFTVNGVKAPFALPREAVTSHNGNTHSIYPQQFYHSMAQIYGIHSYKNFYRYLGKEPPTRPQFLEYLKDSVRRSLAKGYHSSAGEENISLPESLKLEEEKKEKPHQSKFKSLFERLEQSLRSEPQDSFSALLKLLPFQTQQDLVYHNLNKYQNMWAELLGLDRKMLCEQIKNQDLKSLLISQTLTEFLKLFQHFPNFTMFYHFTELGGQHTSHLTLPILSTYELKSGHYWVMKAIQTHKHLQSLKVTSMESSINGTLSSSFLKFICKGLNNIKLAQFNKILLLSLDDLEINEPKEFKQLLLFLSESLEQLHLKALRLESQSLAVLVKSMARMTRLNSIELNKVNLTSTALMNLSDMALSLKKLRFLKISNNTFSGQSVSLFLKNMGFLVRLEYLQLSFLKIENQVPEVHENLVKLISFSRSLVGLNLCESRLVFSITPNFCNALAHCSSLESLILDHSQAVLDGQILGRAVAINSILKHPLRVLSLQKGVLGSQTNYSSFIGALFLNKPFLQAARAKDFQICGNEPYVEPDGSEEKLHCSLEELRIEGRKYQQIQFKKAKSEVQLKGVLQRATFYSALSSLSVDDFNFQDEEGLLQSWNLGHSRLAELSLRHNQLKINEKLGLAFPKSLRVLDLSGNNISDNGIRALLPFIHNSVLEDLNLYQNNLTLQAAKYLETGLKERAKIERNEKQISSLRRVDFGYNRFRDKGSLILLHSLLESCSNITVISLRYNFITTKGCLHLLDLEQLQYKQSLFLSLTKNKIESTKQLKQRLSSLESNLPHLRIDLTQKYEDSLFDPQTLLITGITLQTTEREIANALSEAGCKGLSNIRIRVKRNQSGVKTALAFVEMRDKYAAKQVLNTASSQRLLLNGKRLTAHRAKENV